MAGPPMPNRHQSNQVVGTPREFLDVVRAWRPITIDLASNAELSAAPVHVSESLDTLSDRIDWTQLVEPGCVGWLNPPFSNVAPFAEKCGHFSRHCSKSATVAFLVPASVATNWHDDYVFEQALSVYIRPRLQFIGHTQPYPKDLMLCLFGRNAQGERLKGFATWHWKNTPLQSMRHASGSVSF